MLMVISPAKSLDFTPISGPFDDPGPLARTRPRLIDDTKILAKTAARLKSRDLQELMGISAKLADLNVTRFHELDPDHSVSLGKQAVMAFHGDVYLGLEADKMRPADLQWAQDHLRILSGLYGLLRPLDAIQPYRLEMGIGLKTRRGASLYEFWGDRIARLLASDLQDHPHRALVNLASQEYARSIDIKALGPIPIIHAQFYDIKDGQAKVLGFFAKKARGMMARFIIENRLEDPEAIKDFTLGDYRFDKARSKGDHWAFSRAQPAPIAAQRAAQRARELASTS